VRDTLQLRGEILAAARAEFAQYGLAGARIDRISKSANASKERLYAHFGDKAALFRLVVATDGAEFFSSLTMRPDAVADFAGDVFDLARRLPEHLRMLNWARLEGITLDDPRSSGHDIPGRELRAIEAAQNAGYVDTRWQPGELLVMLFGLGMAWAHGPPENDLVDDGADAASRRAAVIEAAARIIAPSQQHTPMPSPEGVHPPQTLVK
jgi:AcrR family transcriptional regulator